MQGNYQAVPKEHLWETPHATLPAPQSPHGHLRATTRFPRWDVPTQLPPSPPAPCATAPGADVGCGIQGERSGVWNPKVWDLECGIWAAESGVEDPGYRIESEEFGMWDADYETQGVGSVLQWGQEEGQGDHGGGHTTFIEKRGR